MSPSAFQSPEDEEEEEEESPRKEDAWRQYLEDDSSEHEGEDSGEDSDDVPANQVDANRRKSDMDALLRQQSRVSGYSSRPAKGRDRDGDEDEEVSPAIGSDKREEESVSEPPSARGDSGSKLGESPSAANKKKKSMIGRISGMLGSKKGEDANSGQAEGESLVNSLSEDSLKHDDAWYQRWALRLAKEGLACTKVATNGKPYERRVHVDSKNLMIEVRGGRGGATGVLLDDLVDVRQGLCSPEFFKFCQRFKTEINTVALAKRAVVLQTPARTFSFLFTSESQKDTVAHFIVYLLKSKNRGMMASGHGSASPSERAPSEGEGAVSYPNRSTYSGQFHNYMRHGTGTLTLSDGTKYECEWRNDERHGKGKEIWADGTIFTGLYVKGMRHGHGVMTWPEGSKYSGQFERGRANGVGELIRTDGSIYRGHFSEDCMSGEGRMLWRDGVEYVGQFIGNRREGFGKMSWTSGRWKSYEGHWKDGVQHGHGTLADQNNQEFCGTFCQGKLDRWDDDV